MSLDGKLYADLTLLKNQDLKIIRKKVMHGCLLIYRYWNRFFCKVYDLSADNECTETNANISFQYNNNILCTIS